MAEIRVYRSAGVREFEAYMSAIDAEVGARVGVSVYDLPDCPFRDWFEDGVKASSAARRAIKEAA